MFQQINLYRESKKKQIILPMQQIIAINIIFLIGLVCSSIYMVYDYYQTAFDLQKLQAEQDNLNKGLAKVQQTTPTEEDKQKLEKTFNRLEMAKEYRGQMYRALSKIQQRDSVGLSKYLQAMTEPNMTDLWLTKFHLQNNGATITLEGVAIHSSSVPKYLKALGENNVFKNKSFSRLQMFYDAETKQTKFIVGS